MKTVCYHADTNRSGNLLHIETDGCIVNVYVGLHNKEGERVTTVEILADNYVGEEWDLVDYRGRAKSLIARVIRRGRAK